LLLLSSPKVDHSSVVLLGQLEDKSCLAADQRQITCEVSG
jgi:hypothetical protein